MHLIRAAENDKIKQIDEELVRKFEIIKGEDMSTPRGQETSPVNLLQKP